ncbi:unknown [Soft-shelled turtle iridovirus]|uniref:Uncharacterized protein n=1 Tax=Soft-shelled turtle iridovirus TaxID=365144 RepID=C3RWK3_FRG3V|nr:unknown [Soft-shelled turtle iridovirus]
MLHADRLSRRRRTDDVFPKRGLAMDRHRSKHEDHRRYASDVLLNTGAGVGVYAGPHEHYDYTLGDWLEHFSPSEETVDNCLQQALMATAVMHGEMAMAHSRLRPSAVRLAAPDPRHRNSFRLYRMGDREFHLRCDAPHVMLDGFHDTVVYDAVIDPDHGERGTPVGVAVRTKRGPVAGEGTLESQTPTSSRPPGGTGGCPGCSPSRSLQTAPRRSPGPSRLCQRPQRGSPRI